MTDKFNLDTFIEFKNRESPGSELNELWFDLDTDDVDGHEIVVFMKGTFTVNDGEFSHLQIGGKTFDLGDTFDELVGMSNHSLSISEAKKLRDALTVAIERAESAHA